PYEEPARVARDGNTRGSSGDRSSARRCCRSVLRSVTTTRARHANGPCQRAAPKRSMAMRERAVRGPGAEIGVPDDDRSGPFDPKAAMTGRRRYGSLLVGAIVVVTLALPAFAADPSASSSAAPPNAAASEPPSRTRAPETTGTSPTRPLRLTRPTR